jgi:hypothetical protein
MLVATIIIIRKIAVKQNEIKRRVILFSFIAKSDSFIYNKNSGN